MSASIESASRSMTRSRNCRCSTRNCGGRCAPMRSSSAAMSLRIDQLRDGACHRIRVLLDGELRKDRLERGERHEGTQVFDGVVGHDLAVMKDNDSVADALDG